MIAVRTLVTALAAADEVIISLQCEMLSHRGVGQLLDTISDVRRILNPRLRVRGLLPTMFRRPGGACPGGRRPVRRYVEHQA